MAISLTCPHCSKQLRAKDEFEGKHVRCPACRQELVIQGEQATPHDVFVSYSSKDKATADAMCAKLEASYVRCWIAPRDILPGIEWGEGIIDAINESRLMVLIYSSHSNESPQVRRELERAVSKNIPILPFRIEEVPPTKAMEYFIASQHWLDALTPPMEQHLTELTTTVKKLLVRPAATDSGGSRTTSYPAAAHSSGKLPTGRHWRWASISRGTKTAIVLFAVAVICLVAYLIRSLGSSPTTQTAGPSAPQQTVFELRTYTTAPGKLQALSARFREHTQRLFEKHGIASVGYWIPTDGARSKDTLIYVIQHESIDAALASWKDFLADPVWKKVKQTSEVGALAKPPESVFMEQTEYSPQQKLGQAEADDVFELRIYKVAPGKLSKLDARFRDHAIRLFRKHGMKSVGYWHPIDEPDSRDTLIYILKHESRDAATNSWKAFVSDPEWKKVVEASDVGPLAQLPTSIFMKATDYSRLR